MPEALTTAPKAVDGSLTHADVGRASNGGRPTSDEVRPPVILSKVRIPRQRPVTLGRGRLLGWLDQHASDRVVVVSAEVGYGKSTLLADYARRSSARCAWYRVEESDADWISFLGHLVAAVRVALPGFGASTESLLRHVAAVGPTRDIVVSSLLAEMNEVPAERTLVVLDDFHLVGGSPDVRSILRRLLENAPDDWHFAIATRGRPALPIARLAAQGTVAELTTHELRFTRAEVGELFDLHLHHVSADALDIVYERTQGWAACLQLVLASVAASRPSQVEPFITGLSGTQGPIHDLLAQEVLTRLDEATEQVLLHASLLDRVTPDLVVAALSVTAMPTDLATAAARLLEAESLGLLVTADDSSAGSRFHPLLRDYLRDRLERDATDGSIAKMHIAIARAAEEDDWLAAGAHFARGGQPEEAMRVLGSAAYRALGTGAWGAATAVAASTPGVVAPPAVEVIRARALIADGRAPEALVVLDSLERQSSAGDLSILRLTRANGLHISGDHAELGRQLALILADTEASPLIRRVAEAWLKIIEANRGGSVVAAFRSLELLARDVSSERLYYYAGVALHNAAGALLAMGRYGEAVARAKEAYVILRTVSRAVDFLPSTRMIIAQADFESGNVDGAIVLAQDIVETRGVTGDAVAEGAYIAALAGRGELAEDWLGRYTAVTVPGATEPTAVFQAVMTRVTLAGARGRWDEATSLMSEALPLFLAEMDGRTRVAVARASIASARGSMEAGELTREALAAAEQQGAGRWGARARILEAIAKRDPKQLNGRCEEAARTSPAALLETAHAITASLDAFEDVPDWLFSSVRMAPGHWLPILRRSLKTPVSNPSHVAAATIAAFGTIDDASVLRDFERLHKSHRHRPGLVSQLAKRVSPTVRVHDLGRSTCEVGNRFVDLSEARRRAAALLLYLVTRTLQSAPRDQVMEELWPDQPPQSALNSLHQTMFFLRRLLEPWQEDGIASHYVRMEADVVMLNPDLFQIDSVAFHRQATAILASRNYVQEGPSLLLLYRGHFAPEFEYEPWAEDWRTRVHTTFLRLADVSSRELLGEKRASDAADLLTHVTAIDPGALDLRARLIRALALTGSKDAAGAQYRGLVASYERETGEAPPTFQDLISEELDV